MNTKADLINNWLELYPQDIDHPDLEQMAIAGYYEKPDGSFVHYIEYELLQKKEAE